MPLQSDLSITDPRTGQEHNLRVVWSDEEVSILRDYLRFCDDLLSTKFMRRGDWGYLQVSTHRDKGYATEHRAPDTDETTAFFSRLRPFVLEKERTYVQRVRSLVGKKIRNDVLDGTLSVVKDEFRLKESVLPYQVRIQGKLIHSDDIVDKYLNAFEYHRDREKEADIQALYGPHSPDLIKVLILQGLQIKTRAIIRLREVVAMLLNEGEFEILSRLPDLGNE